MGAITIPPKVKNIGKEAFFECKGLEKVVFQNKTKEISKGMFSPNSVTSIGFGAFSNCYHLETIKLPDYIRTIEDKDMAIMIRLHLFVDRIVNNTK